MAYTGDASVSLTPIGNTQESILNSEQDKAHAWAHNLMWMPVVKLMLTYSF